MLRLANSDDEDRAISPPETLRTVDVDRMQRDPASFRGLVSLDDRIAASEQLVSQSVRKPVAQRPGRSQRLSRLYGLGHGLSRLFRATAYFSDTARTSGAVFIVASSSGSSAEGSSGFCACRYAPARIARLTHRARIRERLTPRKGARASFANGGMMPACCAIRLLKTPVECP
jgi:hypothetical protein